jgi:hypothetical protein
MGWTYSGMFHSDVGQPRPAKTSRPHQPTSCDARRVVWRRGKVVRALASWRYAGPGGCGVPVWDVWATWSGAGDGVEVQQAASGGRAAGNRPCRRSHPEQQ